MSPPYRVKVRGGDLADTSNCSAVGRACGIGVGKTLRVLLSEVRHACSMSPPTALR